MAEAAPSVGIGNVWKFPYVTGENGGGVFVLFYLVFLLLMGMPVLTMELAVGRASRRSAVLGYRALEPKGSKWHIHGWFCMAGCIDSFGWSRKKAALANGAFVLIASVPCVLWRRPTPARASKCPGP